MLFVCWTKTWEYIFCRYSPRQEHTRQTNTKSSWIVKWILLVTVFIAHHILWIKSISPNIDPPLHSLWNANCSMKGLKQILAMEIKDFAEKNDDVEAICNHVSVQINPKVVHRNDLVFGWFCAVKWFSQLHEKRFHSRVKVVDTMLNASLNQFV